LNAADCFEAGAFSTKEGEVVSLIHPRDFLKLSSSFNEAPYPYGRKVIVRKLWAEKRLFFSLPFLIISRDQVVQHDGRHRATVLLEAGYDLMPVTWKIRRPDRHTIIPLAIKPQITCQDKDFRYPPPPELINLIHQITHP
jgi:hypothetical protein